MLTKSKRFDQFNWNLKFTSLVWWSFKLNIKLKFEKEDHATLRNIQWFQQHLFMEWMRRYKFQLNNFKFCMGMCIFHCSHRLLCSCICELLLKLLSFRTKIISAWFLWGSVLLGGELCKNGSRTDFFPWLYLSIKHIRQLE